VWSLFARWRACARSTRATARNASRPFFVAEMCEWRSDKRIAVQADSCCACLVLRWLIRVDFACIFFYFMCCLIWACTVVQAGYKPLTTVMEKGHFRPPQRRNPLTDLDGTWIITAHCRPPTMQSLILIWRRGCSGRIASLPLLWVSFLFIFVFIGSPTSPVADEPSPVYA